MRTQFERLALAVLLALPAPLIADDTAPRTAKNFVGDGVYVFTSPLRLNQTNYQTPLICVGIVGVTAIGDEFFRNKLFDYSNTDPSEDLRHMGDYAQVAGPVIGTVFAFHGWLADDDTSKETAYLAYDSFVWAGAVTGAIKYVVGRQRPEKTEESFTFKPFSGDSSFPSGHTTVVFAAATVFSEQYPHWWVVVPSYGAAATVGFSRMYADKHWFSDVVAGAIIGTSVAHVLRKRRRTSHSAWDLRIELAGLRVERKF